jgi:pyruvoyl-dependent arginine decarboxylase (PvlArgDC)
MHDIEELKVQMLRLQAMVSAQQQLLLALFQTHPDQSAALRVFLDKSATMQGLLLFEDAFTEEEIQAEDTAHQLLAKMLRGCLKQPDKVKATSRRPSSK